MSKELTAVKNTDIVVPDKNLLYFLKAFDENSLDGITDMCQTYDNETLSGIIFYLERIKRRSFLFQWSVIATKAYQLKAIAAERNEAANLKDNLLKIFPMYKSSIILRKLRAWDIFYQHPQTKKRAKWNGQSYIFEDLEHGAESWYFLAMTRSRDRDHAIQRLREAESKYLTSMTDPNIPSYNSQSFRIDVTYEVDKTKIIPPFRKYNNMLRQMSEELDKYLTEFDYVSEYADAFNDIKKDIAFLSAECGALKGIVSLEDLERIRTSSRISTTKVSDLDIEKILDPEDLRGSDNEDSSID